MSLSHIAFKNPTHTNGITTAIAGGVLIVAPKKHPRVWFISNRSTTDNLQVSFDKGLGFFTIPRLDSLEIDVDDQATILLKSTGSSQPFEILSGHYPRD